ncbi:hypothetical protein LCGC14_0646390 [marine sediment metagenome]|uniref:ParB-like N-terminal domain-containing protein n=1 Tax=marine sediment metagenome TaxID=412755 RepID=A0A0F9R2S4_9ZZZZ
MFCSNCFGPIEDNECRACYGKGIRYKRLDEYSVVNIPLDRIYSDPIFNCRGTIVPLDVIDLVKDIEKTGLQSPIAIQPISDVSEFPEEDYDYRIVAGHRRFASFKILKKETIPAMIKVGLSEVRAKLINLAENLKRQDLNIVQEANAIEHLRKLGLNRRQVGEELGVSPSWVQVRYNLLDLPIEIRDEVAAGMINQYQIKEIYSLESKEQQFEAVKQIKDAKLRGERGISVGKKPKDSPFKKRRQPVNVVQEMIEHIGKTVGYGLHTRVLAWANGNINSAELYFDIKSEADEKGINYEIPIRGVE